MNILLLDENETTLPGRDPRVQHVRKILKLSRGDRLRAGIINGPQGTAVIDALSSDGMTVRFEPGVGGDAGTPQVIGAQQSVAAPVDLILGHPRPIVLRRLLRDLCTIGIRRLIVSPTELGERSYLGATMWRDVRGPLVEGAAQAGVTRLMEVVRCRSLDEAVKAVPETATTRIVLHPTAGRTVAEALGGAANGGAVLAVGSERGWTENEVRLLTDAGFVPAGMGGSILRTETAAVVAAWIAIETTAKRGA